MPFRSAEYFIYANQYSSDYGIFNVNVSSGFLEEPFVASREVFLVSAKNRDRYYFQDIKLQPIVLKLQFAFEDSFDLNKLRAVARWLGGQTYFQPMIFSDNLERIYYCILQSDSNLLYNGLEQGYVELEFLCNGPYSYSPVYLSPIYDYNINPPEGTILSFENKGDTLLYPEIEITKIGLGNVTITNKSNRDLSFTLANIADNEVVYIDNYNQIILTNLPNTYRYQNFSGDFLELVYGVNQLLIQGNCKVQLRYQFRFL